MSARSRQWLALRPAAVILLAALPGAAGAAQMPTSAAEPPSPAEILGHELGERFTDAAGVVRYIEALAAGSPRVVVRDYGETVEGRRLIQVVVASESNMARLEEILSANRELAEPATPESRARAIAAANPAVVYFSYGVHGNESSSSEAAMWTAWDLARDATPVRGALDSLVVVIDPVANPDGRDRYVNWYRQARGLRPNPSPESWEHWEPWPGGRFNHYLFDLNRDWAWMTQPETRARLATWREWTPQVHVDFHEMGWETTYFFFPAADPINPMYPRHILEWGERFGRANAAAFDERGWPYYTGEAFDLFYPGYGDSWPALVGAIGMTYEQAGHGRAGLAIERPDGFVLTLRDRALGHMTSGAATLRAAAAGRTELLLGFARSQREIADGLPDVLLVPGPDRSRVDALVGLLRGQGIRVERAGREFRANTRAHPGYSARRAFPAGTYLVRARQPHGRLAMTLLQAETRLDATYSYDISAWSLPYAYGVEAHSLGRAPDAGWAPVETAPPVAVAAGGSAGTAVSLFQRPWTGAWEADGAAGGRRPISIYAGAGDGTARRAYGYLLPPGLDSWAGVVRLLSDGARARVLTASFETGGREWPAGTIFLPSHGLDDLDAMVAAAGLADRAVPVHTGFAPGFRDLGTPRAVEASLPTIALLTGNGVSATSFGAHWYFLERTIGLPFDAVLTDRLDRVALDDYDVLVVPELDRADDVLTEGRLERIRAWVERGGTVLALGSGARAVAEPVARITVREREDERPELERGLMGLEERELDRWERQIPGVILPVSLDPAHPLTLGAGIDGDAGRLFILHRNGVVFEPNPSFESAAHFPDGLEPVSGVISPANLEWLAQGSWLASASIGRGRVVLFADDPLFRHFWYSTFLPYVNALLVGRGS